MSCWRSAWAGSPGTTSSADSSPPPTESGAASSVDSSTAGPVPTAAVVGGEDGLETATIEREGDPNVELTAVPAERDDGDSDDASAFTVVLQFGAVAVGVVGSVAVALEAVRFRDERA